MRELESSGTDGSRITVETGGLSPAEQTLRSGTLQITRPLGRAAAGFAIGIGVGVLVGLAIGIASGHYLLAILCCSIAGALLGGLNALYSGLAMSSTAYEADGAMEATIRVDEANEAT